VLDVAHGSEGIEGDGVAGHEAVEEVAQGGERLVFGGRGAGELAQILTGQAGGEVAQLQLATLAPGEEATDDAAVDPAGVCIADAGLKEFLGSKGGVGGSEGHARNLIEPDGSPGDVTAPRDRQPSRPTN
jgi:hypothetical protein